MSDPRFCLSSVSFDNSRVLDWVGWEFGQVWLGISLHDRRILGMAWRPLYFVIHVYVIPFCIHDRLWLCMRLLDVLDIMWYFIVSWCSTLIIYVMTSCFRYYVSHILTLIVLCMYLYVDILYFSLRCELWWSLFRIPIVPCG